MLLRGKEILLVFLRYPEPGRVKTRLISKIGEEGAAEIYRQLAERVVRIAITIDRPGLLPIIYFDPPDRLRDVTTWLGPELDYLSQEGNDLGERLRHGFSRGFESGAERIAAIGTDCIEITGQRIGEAFELLRRNDCVLGPAIDGGYYLIGLSRPLPQVFRDIPWSTDRAASVTLERLEEAGASVHCLPRLRDIDRWEDLKGAGLR